MFAFRGPEGLSFSQVSGPGALLSLRPTPQGIVATPASPDSKVNGEPLQRPRLLGKFDLLELAGALLRSEAELDDSEVLSASKGQTAPQPAPSPDMPSIATGTSFAGRYELQSLLGQGGFGVVYKALDTKLKRTVAIKVLLRAEGRSLQRFAMEIRATAALEHPNLITVFDSGIVDAHPYLVMEFIEGKTLDELSDGSMPHSQLA